MRFRFSPPANYRRLRGEKAEAFYGPRTTAEFQEEKRLIDEDRAKKTAANEQSPGATQCAA